MKEFSKYVGLDVHKETIAVSIAEAGAGEVRYFGEIANTPEAVVKLARQLKKGDARLSFCYEAGSGRGAQRTLQWRQAITWGHHQDRQRPCAPGGSRRGVSRASEWGVQLAVDTSYNPGLRLGYCLTYFGHQGAEHRHIVARRFDQDDSNLQAGEVLLVLEVAVNSEKNLKDSFRKPEQRAVLDTGPSRFANGLDVVTGKVLA